MKRILDPTDRFSEILFGQIMVMTFTCTLSVAEAGREDVRTMLVGALGCNLAWGIVDGVMFVINTVALRARGHVLLRRLKAAADPAAGRRIIADTLPDRVAEAIGDDALESMRRKLAALPDPATGVSVRAQDFVPAGAVCLLVFLTTFPVTIPFMIFTSVKPAMRVSNLIANVILFLLGYSLGRYTGSHPWRLGFAMLLLGVTLVAITILLGG